MGSTSLNSTRATLIFALACRPAVSSSRIYVQLTAPASIRRNVLRQRTFVAYPTSSSHAATSSLLSQGKGNSNDKVVAERVSPERTGRALRGRTEQCARYQPDSPRCMGFSGSCSDAQTHWHPQGCRIPGAERCPSQHPGTGAGAGFYRFTG